VSRSTRALTVALGFGALVLAPRGAAATPQGRGGLRAGVCGAGVEHRLWQSTHPCVGTTGDILFGRERNDDIGVGPFLELSMAGAWDFRFGGGGTLLLPVTADFPLTLSLGAFAHELDSAALGASLFFGARSFNFHGSYNLALGVFGSAVVDLGAARATLVTVGVDVDAFFFATPFVLLANAVR
jgi:hypothetical protein